MKKLMSLVALLAVLVPSVASAHPLGNFSVNHYSRIEPAGDRVRIVHVLDMAEIPTFQERARIDPNPDAVPTSEAPSSRRSMHGMTSTGTRSMVNASFNVLS